MRVILAVLGCVAVCAAASFDYSIVGQDNGKVTHTITKIKPQPEYQVPQQLPHVPETIHIMPMLPPMPELPHQNLPVVPEYPELPQQNLPVIPEYPELPQQNLPVFPEYPELPLQNLPVFPEYPELPLQNLPVVPEYPELPLQNLPVVPEYPELPLQNLPVIPEPEAQEIVIAINPRELYTRLVLTLVNENMEAPEHIPEEPEYIPGRKENSKFLYPSHLMN